MGLNYSWGEGSVARSQEMLRQDSAKSGKATRVAGAKETWKLADLRRKDPILLSCVQCQLSRTESHF